MLDVQGLSVRYGEVIALTDASFSVKQGEIVALLGPNGAGKSSALKAVSGVLDYYDGRISSGEITFGGRPVTGRSGHQLVRRGMGVLAEGRRVFHRLTVRENLEMGGYTISDSRRVGKRVEEIVEFLPHLKDKTNRLAGTLSGGEQQMLALGRALMTEPKLLLADEPSAGLAPNYVEIVFDKLAEISKGGVSVLLAEQNARMALVYSNRAYVFAIGRVELDGNSEELMKTTKVQETFFGG